MCSAWASSLESDDISDEEVFDEPSDFTCETCDLSSKHETGLKIHFSKVHWKCKNCSNSFNTKDKLGRHIEAETTLEKNKW